MKATERLLQPCGRIGWAGGQDLRATVGTEEADMYASNKFPKRNPIQLE